MNINFSRELELIYFGEIRDGVPGTLTAEKYAVYRDLISKVAFLKPFPKIDYETGDYRNSVNQSTRIDNYFEIHDPLQFQYYSKLQSFLSRGSVVLDCGCGGGSFLDLVSGMVLKTIAVEPFTGYHDSLIKRGHLVYSHVFKVINSDFCEKIDFALSNHVIEHVEDPIIYIRDIFSLLRPGGRVVVFTPNLDDILLRLDFEGYAPFWFRRVHNYYFDKQGLTWVLEQAGFVNIEPLYLHQFGLSNVMHWLRNRQPGHNIKIEEISPIVDNFWKSYLEQSGFASDLGLVAVKPI